MSAAIIAFAGNSLIARAALGSDRIGPADFTLLRLASGALVLFPFIQRRPNINDLPSAIALLAYMLGFSLAYRALPAATGALILFAFVQVTIVFGGIAKGDSLSGRAVFGLAVALSGIAWLLAPDASLPSLVPTVMMAGAGVAWGFYTLAGRAGGNPTARTARNFALASVLAAPLLIVDGPVPTNSGIALAVLAGVVTSALGYVLWYRVAPRLPLATVAAVQLATPIAAALGAAVLLAEPLSLRFAVAAAAVLGGIALTFKRR
ncbi:DMT family transporter [Sphingomonas jaspsi]|uniref:DMT family transporter n=1 Tax=Sphingomonas jaspsi TaxID=392409 RepID=UPI0004AE8F5F|nr:DMT family transporter [Sphingomonas jaspsi]